MKNVRKSKNLLLKRAVQIIFILFVFSIVFSHALDRWGVGAGLFRGVGLHALCPFGAVETAGRLLLQHQFIPQVHESNIWIFGGVSVATLLLGGVFCGFLCPLGSVQEWLAGIGRRIFPKRFNALSGTKLDRALGFLRYAILGIILYFTTRAISLVFSRFDPYYALFHFWMGDAFLSAVGVLAVVFILSLFVERPWCRWFCPFGALLGLMQILSPWKIVRRDSTCTSCSSCTRACPMGIRVHEKRRVFDTRCNRCGRCVDACPREGALVHGFSLKGSLPLKRYAVILFLIGLILIPVGVARSGGWFTSSNRIVLATGSLTIEEIKGVMTLHEVSVGLGMDIADMCDLLGITDEATGSTRLIDLEDIDDELTVGNIKMILYERKSID